MYRSCSVAEGKISRRPRLVNFLQSVMKFIVRKLYVFCAVFYFISKCKYFQYNNQCWTNLLLYSHFFGRALYLNTRSGTTKIRRTKLNLMCTSDRETTRNKIFLSLSPKKRPVAFIFIVISSKMFLQLGSCSASIV